MRSILLVGFYGEGNMGDEAILQAICSNLPKDVVPIITSGKKQAVGKSIKRRGLFSWHSFLKAAKKSAVTVFSGGILQDWSWEGVTYFAYRIIAAAMMGSKPVLFGAGIGPLRSEMARKLVKKALSFVKVAYVRDRYSYDLYKSLLPDANVILGTDWTWHYEIPLEGLSSNGVLGVNLRQWGDRKLLNNARECVESFDGSKAGLVCRLGDIRLIEEMGIKNVACPVSFIEFAKYCKSFSFGIAMRYHSALAMIRAGVRAKLICYDEKVRALAESVGMTVGQNDISLGFKTPSEKFFEENKRLFNEMVAGFKKIVVESR